MSTIEDRLRADLHAIAQQAQPQTLRPLRSPAPQSRRQTTRRWIAAVAAAAAVAAVAVGVSLAAHGMKHQPTAAPAAPMPRYYLETPAGTSATVRLSATGAVVATVTPPRGYGFGLLAGTGSDRDFLLELVSKGKDRVFSFETLRLDGDGHPAAAVRVPYTVVPGRAQVAPHAIAENPAATELAVATCPKNSGFDHPSRTPCRVSLLSLATGARLRSWTLSSSYAVDNLSWAGNGMLALSAHEYTTAIQLYEISAAARSGRFLAVSKIARLRFPAGSATAAAVATTDGRMIVAWVYTPLGHGNFPAWLDEYSARTGRLLRVLYRAPANDSPLLGDLPDVPFSFSVDPSGQHVLLFAETPGGTVLAGRTDDGQFTALPHTNNLDAASGTQVSW